MAPVTITQMAGLHTSPNPLDSPPGALQEALNCVVRRKGVIESRRGYDHKVAGGGSSSTQSLSAMFFAIDLRFQFITNGTTGQLLGDNGGELPLIGLACMPRDDAKQRLRAAEASSRLWVADRAETKSIRGGTTPIRSIAGFRPPPDIISSPGVGQLTSSPGFLANTASVAYRYTVVAFLEGRLIESAPSARVVVTNTLGSSRNTSLLIPSDYRPPFVSEHVPTHVRLYRSEQTLPPVVDPGDELFLVAEKPYVLGTAPFAIPDNQPESLLGEPLYTNPITGNGILDANYPPPTGVDVALWDGRLWFGNTRGPSRAEVLLIGVGSSPGLADGNTISIFGITFTATIAAAVPGDANFQIITSGTPAQNIEQTAKGLVAAVNTLTATIGENRAISASYSSTPDDAPGLMMFWQYTAAGDKAADVVVTPATPWQITQQTTQDPHTNGLAFSKPEQPDAFPPTNTLLVNTDAAEILRIFPLRDRLYVFKPDGIYVVSGAFPYRVDLLDGTCRLIAPDGIAACNGSLYALTSQGIVAITDSGARIVSLPIEAELRGDWQLPQTDNPDGSGRLTFAGSYEAERLVYFWVDGVKGYVLNTMHNTWTQHTQPLGLRDGTRLVDMVNDPLSGVLLLAERGQTPPQDLVWTERKDYTRYDFGDMVGQVGSVNPQPPDDHILLYDIFEGFGRTIAPSTIQPGDVLYAFNPAGQLTQAVRIVATGLILPDKKFMELAEPLATEIRASVGNGPLIGYIFRGIHGRVTYSPITAGQPSMVKRFREVTLHFTSYSVESANVLAETDMAMVPTAFPQPIESPKTLWTAERDGPADAVPRENKRRLVPRDKQMGAQILIGWDVEEAFCTWALCGVSVEIEGVSERNSR